MDKERTKEELLSDNDQLSKEFKRLTSENLKLYNRLQLIKAQADVNFL